MDNISQQPYNNTPKKPSGCLAALAIALIIIGLPLLAFAIFGIFETIDNYATDQAMYEMMTEKQNAEGDSLLALQDSLIEAMTAEAQPALDEALAKGDTLLYQQLDNALNANISERIDSLGLAMPYGQLKSPEIPMIMGFGLAVVFGLAGIIPFALGIVFLVMYIVQRKKYKKWTENTIDNRIMTQ